MNWNFLVCYWIFLMNRDLFNNRCIIMDNWSFVMRNMFIFLNYRSLVDYWGFMVICNFMFDRYFRLHCMDFFLVCSCLNMFFRSLNYMFLRFLFFSMWLKLFLVMRLLLRFLHFMFNLGLHFVGNLVMLFHNCLGMLFIMWLNGCMDTVFFCMVLVLVFLFGSLFFF